MCSSSLPHSEQFCDVTGTEICKIKEMKRDFEQSDRELEIKMSV